MENYGEYYVSLILWFYIYLFDVIFIDDDNLISILMFEDYEVNLVNYVLVSS